MKPVVLAVAALSMSALSAQEVVTAEQLLRNSRRTDMAVPVTMYVAGWRDGTSAQLLKTAESLRTSGGEIGSQADYEEALGRCLGNLGVADLFMRLAAIVSTGAASSPQTPARAALLDAAVELCQGPITEALGEDRVAR